MTKKNYRNLQLPKQAISPAEAAQMYGISAGTGCANLKLTSKRGLC